jgi:hypothetical protein
MKIPKLFFKSAALSLLVFFASAFVISPVATAAALVTVTPYENLSLVSPTTVTVSASGLLPNAEVTIRQVEMNRVATGVQIEQRHLAVATTGSEGVFSRQVNIQYDVRADLTFADFCQNSVELGRLCYLQLQYQGGENSGEVIVQYKLYFGVAAPVTDTAAPAVTLTAPADGAVYAQNAVVTADYACEDESGGSSLAGCEGDAPTGLPIDTTTLGTHVFTVNAADNAGNTTSVTHAYTVQRPTPASKDGCKGNGWQNYVGKDGKPFTSQGACVSSVTKK